MPEEKNITCVTCPMGCTIRAAIMDGDVREVTGQACKRGVAFAREEVLNPRRMLTTTVTIRSGILPLLPVRSRSPLPKALLLPAAAVLRQVALQAPVHQGEVVLADILGSGIDMIASRDVERAVEPATTAVSTPG